MDCAEEVRAKNPFGCGVSLVAQFAIYIVDFCENRQIHHRGVKRSPIYVTQIACLFPHRQGDLERELLCLNFPYGSFINLRCL